MYLCHNDNSVHVAMCIDFHRSDVANACFQAVVSRSVVELAPQSQ